MSLLDLIGAVDVDIIVTMSRCIVVVSRIILPKVRRAQAFMFEQNTIVIY